MTYVIINTTDDIKEKILSLHRVVGDVCFNYKIGNFVIKIFNYNFHSVVLSKNEKLNVYIYEVIDDNLVCIDLEKDIRFSGAYILKFAKSKHSLFFEITLCSLAKVISYLMKLSNFESFS